MQYFNCTQNIAGNIQHDSVQHSVLIQHVQCYQQA